MSCRARSLEHCRLWVWLQCTSMLVSAAAASWPATREAKQSCTAGPPAASRGAASCSVLHCRSWPPLPSGAALGLAHCSATVCIRCGGLPMPGPEPRALAVMLPPAAGSACLLSARGKVRDATRFMACLPCEPAEWSESLSSQAARGAEWHQTPADCAWHGVLSGRHDRQPCCVRLCAVKVLGAASVPLCRGMGCHRSALRALPTLWQHKPGPASRCQAVVMFRGDSQGIKEPTLPARTCRLYHCRHMTAQNVTAARDLLGVAAATHPRAMQTRRCSHHCSPGLTRSQQALTAATHGCTLRSAPHLAAEPLSRSCGPQKVTQQPLLDIITFGSHWHWLKHDITILRKVVQ